MLLSANANIRKISKLKELGYDAIDVGFTRVIYHDDPYPHEDILDRDDWEKNLDPYIEEAKAVGLKIVSTHLPYRYDYTDTESEKFAYCHPLTVRSLQASEYLGAEWTVVHMKSVADTVAYVKKLLKDSGVTKIGIALENMFDRPIGDLIEAHDILEKEGVRVGVCFDTGHAHVKKFYDIDVADAIMKLGKRIKMLHVHDNMSNGDRHGAPYTGSIKWEKVMKALADVGYEGAFNFELQPEKVPAAAQDAFERYCVEVGKAMIAMFEKSR